MRQIHEPLTVTASLTGRMGEMFEDLLESLASARASSCTSNSSRRARVARPFSSSPLSDEVWKRLGIDFLWSHQAEALNLRAATANRSSSPRARRRASRSSTRPRSPRRSAGVDPASALLIFPTKALAQDQLRAIAAPGFPGLVAATYDGDTEAPARAWVRRHANVVLTNPEMLHVGMLPFHARWATFLRRLRYVVIDELHVFRGIFGTHVAHVLRRLRRLCARYGASPVFIFTSATVGEPAALASALCGLPVRRGRSTTGRRTASGCSRCGTHRCSTSRRARVAHRTSRPRR